MATARTLKEVEAELAQAKEALANVKGTETEVYARIVGYYRSVRNWNKGKREEYGIRKMFVYEGDGNHAEPAPVVVEAAAPVAEAPKAEATLFAGNSDIVSYELFARKTCPNCPPVKEYMASAPAAGTIVDVDTEAGLARAAELGVFAAPTVIMYNALGAEVARAHNVQELEAVFNGAAVAC
ncbi:MAG: hypothetical protein MJ178_01695 [Treponemataceae bacterium]|nr:hypothetical protein [Treponemataceae bacterium]